MEVILLKDYVHIVRKYFVLFLSIVLICTLLGGAVTYAVPKSYTSSIDIYVQHKGAVSNSFYTYDGYYSNQASLEYTNTVAGFLQTISAVSNAAQLVQADPLYKEESNTTLSVTDPNYLASFQKNIDVKIVAPQLITVTVKTNSTVLSQLWAQSLGTVVTTDLKQLNQEGDANFSINIIHSPITETNPLILWLDLVIGCIIGIVLAYTIGFILESYKK